VKKGDDKKADSEDKNAGAVGTKEKNSKNGARQ